jgi:NTE family protein
MKREISLVLGSGGARGYTHIGIIRWLEQHDYEIRSVAGCSMGALIGGLYAAGKLDEYESWVRQINRFDILKLLDPSLSTNGFIKGEKVINTLKAIVGDRQIESLPVEFTAVATDLANEKEVWLDRGPLFHAIRASIALPLFFTPVNDGDRILLDGGILNPVPIAPTFNDPTRLTIAVNLNAPAGDMKGFSVDIEADEKAKQGGSIIRSSINTFIDALSQWTKDDEDKEKEWNMYDIATQSIDAMQGTIARQKLAAYPPDELIEVPRNVCGILEFDRAEEMIALGYHLAEKHFSGKKAE